jgi:hypothetical protein
MTSTPLIRNSLAQNFLHIPSNKHTHSLSPALFPRLSHASLTQSRQDRLPQKVISQSTPPLQSLIVICSYLPFPQYRLRFVCAIIFMPSSELFSSTLPTTLSSVTNYTIVCHQLHHRSPSITPSFLTNCTRFPSNYTTACLPNTTSLRHQQASDRASISPLSIRRHAHRHCTSFDRTILRTHQQFRSGCRFFGRCPWMRDW